MGQQVNNTSKFNFLVNLEKSSRNWRKFVLLDSKPGDPVVLRFLTEL